MVGVIWFFVWLAFALFMVWLFARAMRTVWKQQAAWGTFARKHGLGFEKLGWYKAPIVDGDIKGRRVRIYVEEIVDPALRVREFRTTIEVYFTTGFISGIALGSRAYHPVLQNIDNVTQLSLPSDARFSGVLAVGRDYAQCMDFITTHQDDLCGFFGMKRTERLLMWHEGDGFLALQSADPLDNISKLNTTIKTIFNLAERLENGVTGLPAQLEYGDVMSEQKGDADV